MGKNVYFVPKKNCYMNNTSYTNCQTRLVATVLKELSNDVPSLKNPFLGFELWTNAKGPHKLKRPHYVR